MDISKTALLASRCSACARKRFINPFNHCWGRRATHGRKVPKMLIVRLLRAVKSYGDEGTLVPVTSGRMRNFWFPRRMADYLTRPELEAVKKSRGLQSIERDVNYGLEWDTDESDNGNVSEKENQETPTLRKTSSIEGLQLSPQRTSDLLRVLVPTKLHFQRQPIIAQTSSELVADKSERTNASMISAGASNTGEASIYGSVSALDVLNHIRSTLAGNEEASRIALSEDNIRFLNVKGDDDKRLKHLGEFLITISINGLPEEESVKKIIKITPSFTDGVEIGERNHSYV